MKIKSTDSVLITGASGGLGTHIARAFAQLGVRLALATSPGNDLKQIRLEVEKQGCECVEHVSDLRIHDERRRLIDTVLERFGKVDILVNNAGIEFTSYYHKLAEGKILDVLKINLEAPMLLTRLLLPQMVERRRGHVVNISSLAGKSGPAFQEPYSATKAGLTAFTLSLRSTYVDSGVSASVIVPGFVDAGIYARMKEQTKYSAPAWLGTSTPEAVACATICAIERNRPEIIVNPLPVRPLLAFAALFPSAGEWLINKIGSNNFFKQVVDAQNCD